ncbi:MULTISPECIES: hypothetical protein [Streptomyces]|uniref:hypothetical protein n=1 Tax=Streptomyces TaxID=1883 RepID=UPI001F0BA522|nr:MULTISPECIES: hypothetical protein [Streptomyces]
MRTASTWLDAVPSLDSTDLRGVLRISRAVLDQLAQDRYLLTRLVGEVLHDPQRLAASRVTLLLNRLSLYQAPDRGFEVRLNMNPRPDNQRVAHDHRYAFATQILAGGYVHVVRRRTNGWDGPFTGTDLEPGIVTIERPGSAYTLGEAMVHQAVMEPDTVTLFVRGPRRAAHRAHRARRHTAAGEPLALGRDHHRDPAPSRARRPSPQALPRLVPRLRHRRRRPVR